MDLQIVVSSVALAFVFMWVQSLYWAMPYRVWVTSALIIGLTTATVMSLIVSWAPGLGMIFLLLIECGLIVAIAGAALCCIFSETPREFLRKRTGSSFLPLTGRSSM